MKSWWDKHKAALMPWVVVVLAGAAVGGYLYFDGSNGGEEIIVVAPSEFVRQVSVSGRVTALQEVRLAFPQGGRIKSVSAVVGERAENGAALAALENDDLAAFVLQKEAALESEEAQLLALQGGTRPEELAIAEANVESADAALLQADQSVVEAIADAFTTADDAIPGTVDQFISNPRSSSPQVSLPVSDSALKSSIESGRIAMETLLFDWEQDLFAVSASENLTTSVADTQKKLAQVASFLAQVSSMLDRAFPTGSVSQTTIDGYKADVGTARSAVNAALSSLTSAVTNRSAKYAALVSAQKNLALLKAGTLPATVAAQAAQVKAAKAALDDARSQLRKTYIIAPFAGVVTAVDAKVGAVASANAPLISLETSGEFQLESYIPEINIAEVAQGNSAEVTLDAYGERDVFLAQVVSVDPATTLRDGVSTYRVVLAFSTPDPRIKSGMTANIRITTDRRENVIALPLGVISEENGTRFVTLVRGEARERRTVTVGTISSAGYAEILSGVAPGDTILVPRAQ